MRAGLGVVLSTSLLVLGGEPALAALALLLALATALRAPAPERLRGTAPSSAAASSPPCSCRPGSSRSGRPRSSRRAGSAASRGRSSRRSGSTRCVFLETPFPQLFGDPSRVVSGAFWGFAVTQGNPPYHASLSFGVVPLALALVFVSSARRSEARFWIAAAGIALLASFTPWLPGARALYEALPALHVLRYPVKALLPFTMAIAVLAARGADRLLVEGALPLFRRRASLALSRFSRPLFAARGDRDAPLAARRIRPPSSPLGSRMGSRRPASSSRPSSSGSRRRRLSREPASPSSASFSCAGPGDARGGALLLAATAVSLLAYTPAAIPRVPASVYETPSPLVARAAALGGRVYERAGKDFDAVRRGAAGRVESGGILDLALAQARQGWALSGAPHGLKYAFDPDPDGSYSILNRYAADVVKQRPWDRRLKWLRAAGVRSVIAGDVPPDTRGLSPLYVEGSVGVPVTLWRVEDPLPGVRRAGRVVVADSVGATVSAFEDGGFDPATDVVVHAKDAAAVASGVRDPSARGARRGGRGRPARDRDVGRPRGNPARGPELHAARHRDRGRQSRRPRLRRRPPPRSGCRCPAGRSRVVLDLAP